MNQLDLQALQTNLRRALARKGVKSAGKTGRELLSIADKHSVKVDERLRYEFEVLPGLGTPNPFATSDAGEQ